MKPINFVEGPEKRAFAIPEFVHPHTFTLDNGIEVYSVLSEETETLKIEWVFEAGSVFAEKVMQSAACAELINKGTFTRNGFELIESLEYYGSYFSADSGRDELTMRLFTMRRFLPDVLPIVAEMMLEAAYPQHEFEVWLDARKSAYEINRKKTDYLASSRFPGVLFGEDSGYGKYVKPEHFMQLTANDALVFHKKVLASPCRMYVSGNVPTGWESLLNSLFGSLIRDERIPVEAFDSTHNPPQELFLPVDDSVQHSLIIGRRIWVRNVEEYVPLMIMNTALGGYFGSRLMANLREKNGFTYGVGSGVARLYFSDMFKISTDVGAEVSEQARKEIFHEINVLQNELLSEEELQRVKTYINGSFLRSFDGPQAIMDRYKSLIQYNLPLTFFSRYVEGIKGVTAEQVRESAQKHLTGLSTVVAGKK